MKMNRTQATNILVLIINLLIPLTLITFLEADKRYILLELVLMAGLGFACGAVHAYEDVSENIL